MHLAVGGVDHLQRLRPVLAAARIGFLRRKRAGARSPEAKQQTKLLLHGNQLIPGRTRRVAHVQATALPAAEATISPLAVLTTGAVAATELWESVGSRPGGTAVTPVGFRVTSAGAQSDLGDLPLNAIASPGKPALCCCSSYWATIDELAKYDVRMVSVGHNQHTEYRRGAFNRSVETHPGALERPVDHVWVKIAV
ncbi:hypothetical protein [Saccharopolyspora sp. NPDC002376]